MLCKVGALLGALPAPDAELLARWVDTGRDSRGRAQGAGVLAAALRSEGHRVGPTTLKDHRGGRCACANRKASA